MLNPNNSPIRIQFGVRGWAAIVAAVIVLGAVTVLAVGFLVFLLPVLILAPVLYWFMPKPKRMPKPQPMNSEIPRPINDADIIEGDFTEVRTTAVERPSESSSGESES